jgi:hypothetical protein
MPLQRLLQEAQGRRFVAFSGDIALEDFALMVHGAPQIMPLAVDLHEHLIKMPAPVAVSPHLAHPLAADIRRKHRSEPVPPEPYCLVADVDAALEQQVLNVAQAQRYRTYIITTSRITSGAELK